MYVAGRILRWLPWPFLVVLLLCLFFFYIVLYGKIQIFSENLIQLHDSFRSREFSLAGDRASQRGYNCAKDSMYSFRPHNNKLIGTENRPQWTISKVIVFQTYNHKKLDYSSNHNELGRRVFPRGTTANNLTLAFCDW